MKRLLFLIPLLLVFAACHGNVCIDDGYCADYEEMLGCADCVHILPDACTMQGGIGCGNFDVLGGLESSITIGFFNKGDAIQTTKITLENSDCDLEEDTIIVNETVPLGRPIGPVTFNCIDNLEPGTKYKADIKVEYLPEAGTLWHVAKGDLRATVQEERPTRVEDMLREGETKTYELRSGEYEMTVIYVSGPGMSPEEAKVMVNGEVSPGLEAGDRFRFLCSEIGIEDILVNSREGVVEFEFEEQPCLPPVTVNESVIGTLNEFDTETYTLEGNEYEVHVMFIGENAGAYEVKFSVNGEVTKPLDEQETDRLRTSEITALEVNQGDVTFGLSPKSYIPPSPAEVDITDRLYFDDSKTYTINGTEYEVTFHDVTTTEPHNAAFYINGEDTGLLHEFADYNLSGCLMFGVDEIMYKPGDALAEFWLDKEDFCSGGGGSGGNGTH